MKADTHTYTIPGHDRRLRTYIVAALWIGIIVVGGFAASKFEANQEALAIAQAKADKEALRAELIVQSSPYASIMTTSDGWIVQSNLAAELLTGYPHDDLVGMSALELVPNEHRERVSRDMTNSVEMALGRDGNFFLLSKDAHVPILNADGNEIQVIVSVRIIKFLGDVQFIVGFRAAEQSQQPIPPSQPVPLPELPRGNAAIDRAVEQLRAEAR